MTKAIIIGSGIGGIATAIRLARLGITTEVIDSAEKAGGKVSERNINGFRFDGGPSLLTLPEMVFDLLDNDLRFSIRKLEIISRYFFEDGTELTAYSNVFKLAEEICQKLQVPESSVLSYLKKSAKVYHLTADLFIFGSFHRLKHLLKPKSFLTLLNFRKLQAFKSLHEFNKSELTDPKLVQLFDRYATYNGSDPYQTPATLSVISHLEHNLGAFIPENGMYELTKSLTTQARRLGVEFKFNQPVRKVEIKDGKVQGIWLDTGFKPSEIVVSDIDIHQFYSGLLPDSKKLDRINKEERSSSALIFFWCVKTISMKLDIHNIFFSGNYREEFEFLFGKREVYQDPTVYIYISSKFRKTDAPEGCENWYVMINAPSDIGQNWDKLVEDSRRNILNKLERMMGRNISATIINEEIMSPPVIAKQTGSANGSIYGSSSNSRYASFYRHANFRNDIKGLYFVGGSVHPGGGLPLCLSSARIVEGLVYEKIFKSKQ